MIGADLTRSFVHPLNTTKARDIKIAFFGFLSGWKVFLASQSKSSLFALERHPNGSHTTSLLPPVESAPKWFNGREFPQQGSGSVIEVTVVQNYSKANRGRAGDLYYERFSYFDEFSIRNFP